MTTKEMHGETNPGFLPDSGVTDKKGDPIFITPVRDDTTPSSDTTVSEEENAAPARDQWGGGLEFLMSCIAMSVGLGNIWRFPFTAYENGGGAFLIPYIIVLILVGKPLYYMEMVMGQFSSKGSVKVYDFAPGMRGIGAGQTVAVICVMTYYASLMALIIYYLFASFASVLPWTVCLPEWGDGCYDSSTNESIANKTSSSELYFLNTVLREKSQIADGIGYPSWRLALCLLFAWVSVLLVLLKGVKSSGKAAYFLAIFPYIVMFILLIRAVTLDGAEDGIIFFIKPDWEKVLDPSVWYAAVTQCFFSLNVCFGNVIMYASYNNFRHNIYRDSMIVTTLDTFTSLLAGFTIFGILGNLAKETGRDVDKVVQGGSGLAFISYPEAIGKFEAVPQLFSVLFFFMLYVLGVGTNVAMCSSIITVIRDKFQWIPHWKAVIVVAIFGFCVGLVYITPGGQHILTLVDHHGGGFIVYILGIGQIVSIIWIYGLYRFTKDIKFMSDRSVGFYWRLCWPYVTPLILLVILLYSLITMAPLEYKKDVPYPPAAIAAGWILSSIGIVMLPLFCFFAINKRKALGWKQAFQAAFRPRDSWGPVDPKTKKEWIEFKENQKVQDDLKIKSTAKTIFDKIFGYQKL